MNPMTRVSWEAICSADSAVTYRSSSNTCGNTALYDALTGASNR
ncbi:hypothetical protein AB0H88_35470 [Nonomuraea sp. NPDC050680]